ncbi:MAG: MFS transporter [Proteobacteria bacterium]|nr:MFS transporter [Pseudomonadota bacterium]
MKGLRWIVLAVIIFASFIAYTLRTNFNVVSAMMISDLGMNEVQLGKVFAAFAAGYAIFQFPGGIFGDKVGPRYAITAIAIAWTLLTVVTAIIPGTDTWSVASIVIALVITRFLVGAAHAPFFPVTIGGTIERWFPVRQWGLPNGLSSTGLTLGAAATAPLVVWLMESYGWRSALLITAPAGLLAALAYYWLVTDDPADHARITAAELEFIHSDRPAADIPLEKGSWKLALKNRNILLIAISYFCMNYVFYLFFSWFFFYLVDVRGFSASDAGMFTAAQWILGAVGATLGGFGCDMLVRRLGIRRGTRYQTMIALVLSGAFLYAGAMSDSVIVTVIMLCCSFGFTQVTEAPMWVATMGVAGRHSQVATGVLNTGGNIPGVVGGLMVPAIAGWFGWPAAIASGSVFALVGAFLWVFIRADEPMVDPDASSQDSKNNWLRGNT